MGAGNRIKVLVLENVLNITGGFTSILIVSNAIQADIETVFVMPKGSACSTVLKESGFCVYELPFVELSRRILDIIGYLPMLLINAYQLNKIIKLDQIQVVHTNDVYNLCAYTSHIFGNRLPIITHVRMMPASFPKLIYRFWTWLHLRLATRIICVSKAVAKPFLHSPKTSVIFGRVNIQENYGHKLVEETNDEIISLLYLGNYMKGKGQEHALRAFRMAFQHMPNLRLTFVGGDMGLKKNKEYKMGLIKQVRCQRLQQVITFKGRTTNPEKEIKSHHIALNFSDSESFSLTCLEALYYGTPLIATDSGGPAELFEDGNSGFLVPIKDIPAMSHAIVTLAADAELRKQFSKEGHLFVKRKFIDSDSPQKLRDIYLQVATPCSHN